MAGVMLQQFFELVVLQQVSLLVVPAQNTAVLLKVAQHPDNSKHVDDRLSQLARFLQFEEVVLLVQETHAYFFCEVVDAFPLKKHSNALLDRAIELKSLFGAMQAG